MAQDAIAIIPARGGSRRLPRKNVVDFLGRPIIAWTIEAARVSGCFARIVVSTEDDEIAGVAARFGAEIARRPLALAADAATVVDVCLDLLAGEDQAGRGWPRMVCLYATAPLRGAADIRRTAALLEPGRCDFAIAVTDFDLPPHQALKPRGNGGLEPMWPELIGRRSSEMPALCVDNGSTYAVTVAAFRARRSFYGPGLRGHAMPRSRSVDIDTVEDLDYARWLAGRPSPGSPAPDQPAIQPRAP